MRNEYCNICGKKLDEYGNNPWPICDINDTEEYRCCDECNMIYVIQARRLLNKYNTKRIKDLNVGDHITIFWSNSFDNITNYLLHIYEITNIEGNLIYGTWGNTPIDANNDNFICIND